MDDVCLVKFECCSKCYVQYVEGREERWLEGWRPNLKEEIKMATVYEIMQGLAQAAANAYDGALGEDLSPVTTGHSAGGR